MNREMHNFKASIMWDVDLCLFVCDQFVSVFLCLYFHYFVCLSRLFVCLCLHFCVAGNVC